MDFSFQCLKDMTFEEKSELWLTQFLICVNMNDIYSIARKTLYP